MMKKITVLLSIMIMAISIYSCQEHEENLALNSTFESEVLEIPSTQTSESHFITNPEQQNGYLIISNFLMKNPNESLILIEEDFFEWISTQESIEEPTKQELLTSGQGGISIVYYTYNEEEIGWDPILLNAIPDGTVQIVYGDVLELDALDYYVSTEGTTTPTVVLAKKKKKKPINVDKKGCTKKVCENGYCHEITFVPCKGSKGYTTCSGSLGSACGSGSAGESLHETIIMF